MPAAVGAAAITLGTLMAFLSYLGMFYGPLSNLTHVSQTLNQFLTISQRMFEMLDEEPQKQVESPGQKLTSDRGADRVRPRQLWV